MTGHEPKHGSLARRLGIRGACLLALPALSLAACGPRGPDPDAGSADPGGRETTAEPVSAALPRWDAAERIRGLSLSAPREEMGPDGMVSASALGSNWVAVIPYGFLSPDAPRVAFDRDRQFWGERAVGVARTIELARVHGQRVFLKPHLWVRGQGWPGEYLPRSEAEWATFLESYRAYILRFAILADSLDVEMLSVGTEVDLVALERPDFWRGLIADVRDVYDGTVTYAANWDRYADIAFWDALDLVGIDAYFPLVSDATPTVERLVEAWEPWLAEVRTVAASTGKPVLFAEFGYRSIDGAAGEQWKLPEGRRSRREPPNFPAQAAAYEALFRAWWGQTWFAGGFLWKWYPGAPSGAWLATDYSPQGKRAETVIASWYGGDASAGSAVPPAALTLTSPGGGGPTHPG